jgi:hypothetical protein
VLIPRPPFLIHRHVGTDAALRFGGRFSGLEDMVNRTPPLGVPNSRSCRPGPAFPPSFLGTVEGFPEILVHATSIFQVEQNLPDALIAHLKRSQDLEATRLQLDDFPTVRFVRLYLGSSAV